MAESAGRNAGFIFLHRSIRDHWIWKDAIKFQWWVDILMECNHSDQNVSIGFQLMECRRGQSLNSLLTWSKMWRVDISTVRRFLKLLENDKMVVTENVQKTTRLTVCNYDTYNTPSAGKATDRAISKQRQRNSDAIQTIMINNDKEGGGHSPKEIEDYKKFLKWIDDHASRVNQMKEPFSINQFLDLKNTIAAGKISDLLKAMHNYEPLLKKNISANLTIRKWAKRDESPGGATSKTGQARKMIEERNLKIINEGL